MRWFCLVSLLLLQQLLSAQNKFFTPTGLRHLDTAMSYEKVTEKTGRNDGPVIRKFLRSVGLREGMPYCASFVSYVLIVNKIPIPSIRSGSAQAFKKSEYVVSARDVMKGLYTIPKGSIVIWEKARSPQGHVGFVIQDWNGPNGITIEANTSPSEKGDQRDGEGIYIKKRRIVPTDILSIKYFALVFYNKDDKPLIPINGYKRAFLKNQSR